MIKTVIFDIGNVLADFSWEPFFRKFSFSEEVLEKLAKKFRKSKSENISGSVRTHTRNMRSVS